MTTKDEKNLLEDLKFVPQVTLLAAPKEIDKSAIAILLKKIICQDTLCAADNLCHNCQKLKDNCYFDLNWYQFNQENIMKKQDVSNIITTLSYQSIETSNPKICVLEAIEYSSLEASNIFLKFLENLSPNTFLIFTSKNLDRVLPTIKSRCQIINLSATGSDSSDFDMIISDVDFKAITILSRKFIINDNNKTFSDNFFLIKDLVALNDKLILFFQFLLVLTKNKIIMIDNKNSINPKQVIKEMLENWKNNDYLFLINLIEILSVTINKLKSTKNLNPNLLLNHFFITIYQGKE